MGNREAYVDNNAMNTVLHSRLELVFDPSQLLANRKLQIHS